MSNQLIKNVSKAILAGSILLSLISAGRAQPAAASPPAPGGAGGKDQELVKLDKKLDEVKADLLKVRLLVATSATAQDLDKLGADLSALAAPLHMLSKDISNSANNTRLSVTRYYRSVFCTTGTVPPSE